jgi:Ion channel
MNRNIGTQGRNWRRWTRDHEARIILAATLLLILMSPVQDYWRHENVLVAPTMVLLVFVAHAARRPNQLTFNLIPILAIAWLAAAVYASVVGDQPIASAAVMLALEMVVFVVVMRWVFDAKVPDPETLSAALCGYLIIGAIGANIYSLVLQVDSAAFGIQRPTRNTLLYFSLGAMTTLGYGDVRPVNSFARMLAVTQAVTAQFYIATVIARLVVIAKPRGDE